MTAAPQFDNVTNISSAATGTQPTSMTTGQKTGLALAITAAVALLAEGSRRLYRKRQEKAAEAAKVDAAAAAHLQEVADLQAKVDELQRQLEAVLSAQIAEAAEPAAPAKAKR